MNFWCITESIVMRAMVNSRTEMERTKRQNDMFNAWCHDTWARRHILILLLGIRQQLLFVWIGMGFFKYLRARLEWTKLHIASYCWRGSVEALPAHGHSTQMECLSDGLKSYQLHLCLEKTPKFVVSFGTILLTKHICRTAHSARSIHGTWIKINRCGWSDDESPKVVSCHVA